MASKDVQNEFMLVQETTKKAKKAVGENPKNNAKDVVKYARRMRTM